MSMTLSDLISTPIEYFQGSLNNFDAKKLVLKPEEYTFFFYSFVFWVCIYLIIHFFVPVKLEKKKDLYDTKTRFVSIIHASLMFLLALYDWVFLQENKCGQTNSEFQNKVSLFSCAYFLYDLITCILLDCSDNEMVVHHLFCMLGYTASVGYNNSANEILRALVITEVTCPIMHIRMILKNYKLKHTKLHKLLDYIYMVMYLIARMGIGSHNIIFTVFCRNNLLLVKIAGGFIFLQSLLFSKRMVKILKHKKAESKERKQKGIELFWFSHNKKVEECEYYKNSLKKHAGYIP